MTILVVAPGANTSTKDVHQGVVRGLSAAGAKVVVYNTHGRMRPAESTECAKWRVRRKQDPTAPRPTFADISYQAHIELYERGYRFNPDAYLFVSGVLVIGETFRQLRTRHLVGVLLTESPYLMEQERRIAAHADIAWTNERAAVPLLRQVQPRTSYLPHAWLPGVHDISHSPMPAHDVVFIGTDFKERIDLLERVDWTGIDLGLYGNWSSLRADSPLHSFVRGSQIDNGKAAALYRQAKIGLNLYRTTTDYSGHLLTHPTESLNPRAYELAAGGVFTLSTPRAEVTDKFGALVPTFSTATELTALLRRWLADDAGRAAVASQLPACVAEDTWLARGRQLLADLRDLRARAA